jgi:MSHA biogenesis protein MshO
MQVDHRLRSQGFTLVEMVVAITLIAVLAAAAVPLFQWPMRAYLDSARRSESAQALDLVASKLRDELTQALPNSVRVTADGLHLEYLPVVAQGRYRSATPLAATPPQCPAACSGGSSRDVLQLGTADNCFTSLGPLLGRAPTIGSDQVVVQPLGLDVYQGGAAGNAQRSPLIGLSAAGTGVCLQTPPHTTVLAAPDRRFYLASAPVSYVCDRAAGTLTRRWGYALTALQPTTFGTAASAPLALQVSDCQFTVTPIGPIGAPTGHLVTVRLQLSGAVPGQIANEAVEATWRFAVGEAP